MNKKSLAVGIDIGGTNTKFGIVTPDGKILEEGRIPTTNYPHITDYVDALYGHISPIIEKYKDQAPIRGIGIGAPNGNHFTGSIEHAPNLLWKGIVPLAKMVNEKFNLPCVLNNDAKSAALGEHKFGAAKGLKDFIMITLGTGVGSGIFVNGKLLYGNKGDAGELGHTVVRYNGRLHWSTGLKGTLEAYCSATGMVLTALELRKKYKGKSLLKKYKRKDLTAKAIYDCAMKGDKLARDVFKFTGTVLGEALANFVMFSSPEAIILFGGVTAAGDLIMKPTKKVLEKHLLTEFKDAVRLEFSQLAQNDAAILGASTLV
ncbi:ROK family protein [Mucilaginibacter ginkgonis]|uniref:ROK family protein n=1 Tax=Mucilaginibacter ginkgonis TaxID=2682091 RepID=A0A7T7JH36_9SPHI|nr:ROK family protein [Mucilaginibacter ginkgonis]QQL49809.1 ROK family protein [Mucilaginibacter ginkgonis]